MRSLLSRLAECCRPPTGGLTQCGRDYVSAVVVRRRLAELVATPRLFVVTRSAASVLPSSLANFGTGGDCVDPNPRVIGDSETSTWCLQSTSTTRDQIATR